MIGQVDRPVKYDTKVYRCYGSLVGASYRPIALIDGLFDALVEAWQKPDDYRTSMAKITIITPVLVNNTFPLLKSQ
jgi:hypothetical protein